MSRILLLVFALPFSLHAVPPIDFVGVLSVDGASCFRLTDRATETTRWLKPGDIIGGFTVVSYNSSAGVLRLIRDTEELSLVLPQAGARPDQRLPPEAIVAIRTNLRVLAAAAKLHFLEGKSRYATFADLVGPEKSIRQLLSLAGEDYRRVSFLKGESVELRITTSTGEIITVNTATE